MHTQTSYTSAFLFSLMMLPAFQLQATEEGSGAATSGWSDKQAGCWTVAGIIAGGFLGAVIWDHWRDHKDRLANEEQSKCKKQEDAHALQKALSFLQIITTDEANTPLINRIEASNSSLYRMQTFFHLIDRHIAALERAEARENCDEACQDTKTRLRLFLQQAREDKAVYNAQIKEKEERVRLETVQAERDIALAVSERERIWAAEAAQQKERADSAHTHTISLLTTANAEFAKLDETAKKGFEKITDRLAEQTEQLRTHNNWQTQRSVREQQLISELSHISPVIEKLNTQTTTLNNRLNGLPKSVRKIVQEELAKQAQQRPENEQSNRPPAYNPEYNPVFNTTDNIFANASAPA